MRMKISEGARRFLTSAPTLVPDNRIDERKMIARKLEEYSKFSGSKNPAIAREIENLIFRKDLPEEVTERLLNRFRSYSSEFNTTEDVSTDVTFDPISYQTIRRFRKKPMDTSPEKVSVIRDFLVTVGQIDPRALFPVTGQLTPAYALRDTFTSEMLSVDKLSNSIGNRYHCYERTAESEWVYEATYLRVAENLHILKLIKTSSKFGSLFTNSGTVSKRASRREIFSYWVISVQNFIFGMSLTDEMSQPQQLTFYTSKGKIIHGDISDTFTLEIANIGSSEKISALDNVCTKNPHSNFAQITRSKDILHLHFTKGDGERVFAENKFNVYNEISVTSRFLIQSEIIEEQLTENRNVYLAAECYKSGDILKAEQAIREAVKNGENVNARVDERGNTLLHYACSRVSGSLVQELLKSEDIDLIVRNAKGDIPLDALGDKLDLLAGMAELRDEALFNYVLKYTAQQAKERGISEAVRRSQTGGLDGIIPRWGDDTSPQAPEPGL